MNEPIDRMKFFRAALAYCIPSGGMIHPLCAERDPFTGEPLTIHQILRRFISRFGGDGDALPSITMDEAKILYREMPYDLDCIYHGLQNKSTLSEDMERLTSAMDVMQKVMDATGFGEERA